MKFDMPRDEDARIRVMFSKKDPAWKKTIYIVGLPRSGKSTVYNVLASCEDVEALEEPFDLLAVAQKASQFAPGSDAYMHYHDLYLAFMENDFSELVLGRTYNFRRQDKSCIFNYKTAAHVDLAHSRARRMDVLNYAKNADASFVIAFNDVEQSIDFVSRGVPGAQFVYVKRALTNIARDVVEKKWLSDEQLSTQANMAPAYSAVVESGGRLIYLPYFIQEQDADLFVSLDDYERAVMYVMLQDRALTSALSKTKTPCHSVSFEDMVNSPEQLMNELIHGLGLKKTETTEKNIQAMKSINIAAEADQQGLRDLSPGLKSFLRNRLGCNV